MNINMGCFINLECYERPSWLASKPSYLSDLILMFHFWRSPGQKFHNCHQEPDLWFHFLQSQRGLLLSTFLKKLNKSLPLFKDVIWTLKLITKQHKREQPRTRLQADPQTGKRAWLTEAGHAALSAQMRLHTPWVSALMTKVHKVKKQLSSSWKESSSCAMKKYFLVTGETLSQAFHTF